MERIEVMTPSGPGIIWGIGPGKVLVEMDYSYLVVPGGVQARGCGRDRVRTWRGRRGRMDGHTQAKMKCHGRG